VVRKKFYFDDVFADIMLMHTLNHATFKGAEIGECLAAASKVVEGNAESWRRAWQEQGEKAERAGRQADGRGHGVSAREAYLRAVTYYYHACLAIGVDDPAFRAGVEHYRSLFARFAALCTPPVEVIGIPYQDTRLPAYFLRPDAGGEAHPTVVIGDNTSEELYYWVGPPGVERGYNVLLVDLPGMGLNTFHGVYFRPDTEVAVGACIDYLSKRGDVDPARIAFYGGGEPGGWVAVRAAAREPRIAACVADPYVADSDAILSVFHRPDVAALSQGPQTVPGQAQQTARFYEGEPGRGYGRLVAEPQKIQCPLLCLNDPSDNEQLRRQAAAAVEAAPNPASRHQVFTPEDGTLLYRQLDNFSLKHRVMFDWLDEVLGQH
jgi:pimeloyl-ACP methyl ester carboxylesterase